MAARRSGFPKLVFEYIRLLLRPGTLVEVQILDGKTFYGRTHFIAKHVRYSRITSIRHYAAVSELILTGAPAAFSGWSLMHAEDSQGRNGFLILKIGKDSHVSQDDEPAEYSVDVLHLGAVPKRTSGKRKNRNGPNNRRAVAPHN